MEMDYPQALAFLHGAPRFKGTAGLRRIRRLMELLGNPQNSLRFVHIAGTNGKGSTAHLTAAALTAAGYRTGLYISPFVVDFRERMQVDGKMISRRELCCAVERVHRAEAALRAEGENATEFELVTATGFCVFAAKRCELVVLEVGIGGRFDATNVINQPEAAVITKIALDHMTLLGNTLEEIAAEKCGILKGGDAVSYPCQEAAALETIQRLCAEGGTRLHVPELTELEVLSADLSGCRLRWRGEDYAVPLGGEHQIYNAVTALETLELLRRRGWEIPLTAVRRGFSGVRFPARLEQVCAAPRILLDGAHNPDGMNALTAALRGTPCTVVYAAMRDKDYTAMARMAAGIARRFIACGVDMPRAAFPQEILRAAADACACMMAAETAAEALSLARGSLMEGESIVFCGSLYLCCDARVLLCATPSGGEA